MSAPVWLNERHRRELEQGSAIARELVDERKYQSIERPSNTRDDARPLLDRLGIPRWATREDRYFPGLLIPLYGPSGRCVGHQFKPNTAVPDGNGKTRKYASAKGQASRLDVHPRNRDRVTDPTVPLWITEGVKKADALTTAGLCVVALSGVFNWRSSLGTLGDWEEIPLRGRDVGIIFDADARTNPNVLRAMQRLGRWLESRGVRRVAYLIVPEESPCGPVKGADDFLAAGGTVADLMAAATPTAPEPPSMGVAFTDARMAETIAEDVLLGRYVWAKGMGWQAWDGQRWRATVDREVTDAVRTYLLQRHARAAGDLAAGKVDKAVVDAWSSMLSASRIAAVFRLAAGVDGVLVDPVDFDAHPDLLNVANGVVDLRTGALMPHDPDLRMTKLAPVAYRPGATHPDWSAALDALPPDVVDWYRLRVGQAATGHTPPDDLLLVQVGGGENGKTTVAGAIRQALGDYFVNVSHRALVGDPSQHPTELMAFRGARLALIEETPEARRLSTVRLKQAVGTPQMRARFIRADEVEWDASHSLFISTNYRPEVEETDHGTWRRLALVRFPYTFRKPGEPVDLAAGERPGDPGLRQRLQAGEQGQHEAVLAWIVTGAVAWYAANKLMPVPPETIVRDTRAWRAEADQVLAYIDDRLVFDPGAHIAKAELLADFNGWLRERGHRDWSDKTLSTRFGTHGEATRHHVRDDRVRLTSPGLSRPPAVAGWLPATPLPERFRAWLGVRFRLPSDDAGTSGTGSLVTPHERHISGSPEVPSHPSPHAPEAVA